MLGHADRREALELWLHVAVETVKRDGPDLTARQLAALLTVYLTPPPHTVRGLAAALSIGKPAVTRALDALGRQGLVKRKRDEEDGRNVLIQRTARGSIAIGELGDLIVRRSAAKSL